MTNISIAQAGRPRGDPDDHLNWPAANDDDKEYCFAVELSRF
jgi:hypothetical protein